MSTTPIPSSTPQPPPSPTGGVRYAPTPGEVIDRTTPNGPLLTQAAALITPMNPADPRWGNERPATFDGSR